jgi:hypothetical protein
VGVGGAGLGVGVGGAGLGVGVASTMGVGASAAPAGGLVASPSAGSVVAPPQLVAASRNARIAMTANIFFMGFYLSSFFLLGIPTGGGRFTRQRKARSHQLQWSRTVLQMVEKYTRGPVGCQMNTPAAAGCIPCGWAIEY